MRLYYNLFFLCMLTILASNLYAEENVIWQIGDFDNNYEELAIPHDYGVYQNSFPDDVMFYAGKDNASGKWPFIQPGTNDQWAGGKAHPFVINFNLPDKPSGVFRLTIGLVGTHSTSPPAYEIDINGRSDRLKLPQGTSDAVLGDASKGNTHTIDLTLPAWMFKQGENSITLTCMDGSWVIYDALRLSDNPLQIIKKPVINSLELRPTKRFVKKAGKLMQIVEINAGFSTGAPSCIAKYSVGGIQKKVTLHPSLLGSAMAELEIDEVTKPVKVIASIESGGIVKTAECEVKPQKHWKIYVQASSHVDIGYTDVQENIKIRHNENISKALDLMREYPDFKWNTESAWTADNYLSMMPEERRMEFIERAREGRIGCQTIYGNMLTGICSHEELIRTLYFAHSMARKYDIPFDMAMSSDVPTDVWTLPTVLVGSGIKYFSSGLNLTRGESFQAMLHKSPFYWQGPDGSKVLTWLAPGYAHAAVLALNERVESVQKQIEGYFGSYVMDDYPYDAVLAFGGFADNVPIDPRIASVTQEWNKRYAFPKIILCRGPEFFEYMESKYKDQIPTITGDAGVYWEDGAGSSAKETSLNRQAKEDLVTAEKIYALLSASGLKKYPVTRLDNAWKDAILYDEHTWGAAGSIDQPESEMTLKQWAYKAKFATRASTNASDLRKKALDDLAKSIDISKQSVIVFNPHSWQVSGPVIAKDTDHDTMRFWADNIPPMGYKVIPTDQIPTGHSSPQDIEFGVIDSKFYRLEINPSTGAVKSLFDKELNRELVDQTAKYGINQYVYIAGQGGGAKDVTHDLSTTGVKMAYTENDYCKILDISGSAYNTPLSSTRLIVYNDIKRIDFLNNIEKTPTYSKEAGYYAFPFALNKPKFYVELPNGVVSPNSDMLPGACMSWYCAQDYVAASDDSSTVVWSAVDSPLLTIGDINRDTFKSPLQIDNGHLYAYAYNNYWFTNYKAAQGGKLQFRFSLTSMKNYDPVEASKFGQSIRNPLLCLDCKPQVSGGERMFSDNAFSLCSVAPSNVYIQSVKKAKSGEGLIIRLREIGGKQAVSTVSIPGGSLNSAWVCNLVEDPQKKLSINNGKVTLTVPANGIATILLK
ncbi:MAG: polysaccharide lyase family protein [Armatimonadota bacterium]